MTRSPEAVLPAEGGITIFQEEYRYWRKTGLNHICALNKARDYHRRFTSREITENWDVLCESVEDENQRSPEELVIFNELVEKVVEAAEPRERKLLFLRIRQLGLDQHLNDENTELCEFYAGEHYPNMVFEIAEVMGWSCQASGSSVSAVNSQKRLRDIITQLGLK